MILTSKLRMDLLRPGSTPILTVTQTDANSRRLELTLFADRKPFVFPEGGRVVIRYERIDGSGGEYDALPDGTPAWSARGNVLTLQLVPEVLTFPGSVMMTVTLLSDGMQTSTQPVQLDVVPVHTVQSAKSKDYFYVLTPLPAPENAKTGHFIQVSAVNSAGKVTAVKAVPADAMSTGQIAPETIRSCIEEYFAANPVVTEEADPTVPDWAKQPEKPGYCAEEVGALPATTKIPEKPEDIGAQPAGSYLTEHQDISGKLDADKLPEAIEAALAQAKASGEFDGADGKDGLDGKDGADGKDGLPGSDYVITDGDREALLAEVRATANQQTPLFASSLEECTDTGKVYVLPDGYLYGYLYTVEQPPEITLEGTENSYWNYDAANNTFRLVSSSGWYAKLSNVIPVTPGDQISYQGKMQYSGNKSYLWFDANGVVIESGLLQSEASPTVLTAPDNAAWFQCTSFAQGSLSNVILNVEWVLCQAAAPKYAWTSTGHAFVPADYEDRILALESGAGNAASALKGKKIVYDGDSICTSRTGTTGNNGGSYAKLIADRVGGTYINLAQNGARLTTAAEGETYHSVVDNLPNLPADGDLYCFEGGINDYWTPKALGTFSKTDFTGELDSNTVCGALETIFRYALTNFLGKPICFVIVHKIQSTAYLANTNGDTFEDYRNAMVGICNKYSIPCYDAFTESGLNGWNEAQSEAFLTATADGTADGIHPNEEGYLRYYVPQLISLFEKLMAR